MPEAPTERENSTLKEDREARDVPKEKELVEADDNREMRKDREVLEDPIVRQAGIG